MHNYYNDDGELNPEELVKQCAMSGIHIMPTADHNGVRANDGSRQAARRAGVGYISGIEIDCTLRGVNLYILRYGFDDTSDDFANIEDNISGQAVTASRQIFCATRKMGLDVIEKDMEKLAGDYYWKDRWTGEMFAEVLLGREEYKDHPSFPPYREGEARGDNSYANLYWDFYSQGKCCYVKVKYPKPEQTVDVTYRDGGYAVLAHLGANLKDYEELLDPILEAGVGRIEAFSSYHSERQTGVYHKAARGRFRVITYGSDYYGKTKPSIPIDGHGCTVPYEEVVRQLERILGENG